MKSIVFTIGLLFLAAGSCYSQNEQPIDKVRAPGFPAGVIIDNQVSTIQQIKSWSSLEACVFNNFYSEDGKFVIPNDFGFEFSPYWASKETGKTEKYIFGTPASTLLKNIGISISSTKSYYLADSVKSDALGFGFRTTLWSSNEGEKEAKTSFSNMRFALQFGNKVNQIIDTKAKSETDIKVIAEAINSELKKYVAQMKSPDMSIAECDSVIDNYIQALQELKLDKNGNIDEQIEAFTDAYFSIDANVQKISDYVSAKKGFKLELASAIALDFPTNETEFSVIPKYGAWITADFGSLGTKNGSFLAVIRYYKYNRHFYNEYCGNPDVFDHTLDLGVKAIVALDKVTIEGEISYRSAMSILSSETDSAGITTTRSKSTSDLQYLATVNYSINPNLSVSYSLGKQFDPLLNFNSGPISKLTLNIGLGMLKRSDITENIQ